MKEIALKDSASGGPVYQRRHFKPVLAAVPDIMEYSQAEMLSTVDFELPLAVNHLDKL